VNVLERFRQEVEQHQFPGVGHITVSTGLAECPRDLLPSTVIDRADKALYYAKQHGRNRLVRYRDVASRNDKKSGEVNLFYK
jgi:PleD family two-component response regulator